MITAENIASHEFIDETKSMFVLQTENGEKKIPKAHNKWKFVIQDQEVILFGESLCKRPSDRVRMKL